MTVAPARLSPADQAAFVIATGAGSGYFPVAPGTAGTLVAIPLYMLMAQHLTPLGYLFGIVAVLVIAVYAADRVCRVLGKSDPGLIVVDEIVGYLVTMALIPWSWTAVVLGFFLFRGFDIFKVSLVKKLEELPGGLGVVMDDFLAGVLANLVLRILLLVIVS